MKGIIYICRKCKHRMYRYPSDGICTNCGNKEEFDEEEVEFQIIVPSFDDHLVTPSRVYQDMIDEGE